MLSIKGFHVRSIGHEGELERGGERRANERSKKHHPEVLETFAVGSLTLTSPDRADDRRPEGTRGVDRAAVDRQQQQVRDEDRETDGDACIDAASRFGGDSRLPNHVAKQKGAENLADERAALAIGCVNDVCAQRSCLVKLAWEDDAQHQRTDNAPHELERGVHEPLPPRHLPAKHKRECDRAVDLPARVWSDGVRQDHDAHTESKCHEQPRLSVGGSVPTSDAAPHDHEDCHGNEFRNGGLHVQHSFAFGTRFGHARRGPVDPPRKADHDASAWASSQGRARKNWTGGFGKKLGNAKRCCEGV
mmetsp:Transcript_25995/g.72607  ORF Transcript_25995/g.72607 Transcript_25995/m.72607 type:complete len:304 (+) Transcript_25995:378-1289(+)